MSRRIFCIRQGMQLNLYLTDNLRAMMDTQSSAAFWLAKSGVDPDAATDRFFVNEAGILDFRMDNDEALFAKLNPSILYSEWVDMQDAHVSATVLVGVNLGYGLNHILEKLPQAHRVLVVEPRPVMLLACLGQTDYTPFIRSSRLEFLAPSVEAVEGSIRRLDVQFVFGKIHLRGDLPSQQMGPEYAATIQACRAKLENFSVELATLRQMQDIMIKNELGNYNQAFRNGSLSKLAGRGIGLSSVILGAGPSLPTAVEQLRGRDENLFKTCALQTLPALERLNYKPDLVLGLDFRPEIIRGISDLADRNFAADIPLVYSTKMDPAVVEAWPGPKLPLWTMGGLGTFMLRDNELVLDAGGNVTVTLGRFLVYLGCKSIILAGCDFCWQGTTTHAAGHHTSELIIGEDTPNLLRMTNMRGEAVLTNLGYLSGKRDLEKDCQANPGVYHYLYAGGLPIDGATLISAESGDETGLLSGMPGAKTQFLSAMASVMCPTMRAVYEPKLKQWSMSLRNVQKRLEKLFKKPERNDSEIRGTLNQLHMFLRQDPLYLPYLYNELLDVGGLINAPLRYTGVEMVKVKDVIKRSLSKVREMDQQLSAPVNVFAA